MLLAALILIGANSTSVVVLSRDGDMLSLEAKTALLASPPGEVRFFDPATDRPASVEPTWSDSLDSLKQLISTARKEAQSAPSPAARRLAYENALALIRLVPEAALTYRSQSLIALSRDYGRLLLQMDGKDPRIDELLTDLAFREELQPQDAIISDERFLARYELIRARLGKARPVALVLDTNAPVSLSIDGREPTQYAGQPLSLLPGSHELVVKGSGLIRRIMLVADPVRVSLSKTAAAALVYTRSGFALRSALSRELGAFIADETHASEVWNVESTSDGQARITVYDSKARALRSSNFATGRPVNTDALLAALAIARASAPSAMQVVRAASGRDPLAPTPAVETTVPAHKKWWVWVIVGGAVAAAATATAVAIVMTRKPGPESPAAVQVTFQ